MELQKTALFWIKKIKEMNNEEIKKFQRYEKIFKEKGYKVEIKELSDFHNSVFLNSIRHIGGNGVIRDDGKIEIIDFIEFLEKDDGKILSNY